MDVPEVLPESEAYEWDLDGRRYVKGTMPNPIKVANFIEMLNTRPEVNLVPERLEKQSNYSSKERLNPD